MRAAATPWSPGNDARFPTRAKARAVELLRVGSDGLPARGALDSDVVIEVIESEDCKDDDDEQRERRRAATITRPPPG